MRVVNAPVAFEIFRGTRLDAQGCVFFRNPHRLRPFAHHFFNEWWRFAIPKVLPIIGRSTNLNGRCFGLFFLHAFAFTASSLSRIALVMKRK